MGEECVDEASEAGDRVVVGVRDRVVASVAARHHERGAGTSQEEMVQRRVRQEHSEVGRTRSDRRRDAGSLPTRADDDRPRRRRELADRSGIQHADGVGRGQVRHHHREGLVVARLATAELPDRSVVTSGDREVVTADALDADDRATVQRGDGRWSASSPSASGAPAASRQVTRGPQVGQALGCAWNRRSPGSSYSARHDSHIVKPAMVVAARSYGTDRVIV